MRKLEGVKVWTDKQLLEQWIALRPLIGSPYFTGSELEQVYIELKKEIKHRKLFGDGLQYAKNPFRSIHVKS